LKEGRERFAGGLGKRDRKRTDSRQKASGRERKKNVGKLTPKKSGNIISGGNYEYETRLNQKRNAQLI